MNKNEMTLVKGIRNHARGGKDARPCGLLPGLRMDPSHRQQHVEAPGPPRCSAYPASFRSSFRALHWPDLDATPAAPLRPAWTCTKDTSGPATSYLQEGIGSGTVGLSFPELEAMTSSPSVCCGLLGAAAASAQSYRVRGRAQNLRRPPVDSRLYLSH